MFIFAITNIGSEKLLKEEVAIKYPHLKPSYQRPGFITFKNTDEHTTVDSSTELDLIFARIYGECLGRYSAEELGSRLERLPKDAVFHKYSIDGTEISGEKVVDGDVVIDIIKVSDNEFWLGQRNHSTYYWPMPFAAPMIVKPDEAPSRAYLKMEEAFIWSQCKYMLYETALELGSAPGGASYSLLRRGLEVYGADTAIMNNVCLDNSKFTHLAMPMQKLTIENLPEKIDILVCDVNLSPKVVIPQLRRFVKMRKGITRMFYTLKIGERMAVPEIPIYLKMIENIGFFKVVRATQLPSNHSEILIYASHFDS